MLSSLCQQTRRDLLSIDVAYLRGNGQPSTEAVLNYFRQWISLKDSAWDNYKDFQKRGLVRNRQLQETQTEWLIFSDCDMVYHPDYIECLCRELEKNHACATYMISSGRCSNPKELANQLVDMHISSEPILVMDAFGMASRLPSIPRRNVGAGFSQIINLRHAPHGNVYVTPETNKDWAWDIRMQKARSDIQFRRKIFKLGGARCRLPTWFSENLIHLNHNRDSDFGRHIEEQR